MHTKILKFEINPQNKQVIELQLQSKQLQAIRWDEYKIYLDIDLNYIAFGNFDNLNNLIFNWLKNEVISLTIAIYNLPDNLESRVTNLKFFNSIINKLRNFSKVEYLKIILPQKNIFKYGELKWLAEIRELKILDLKDFCLEEDQENNYLIAIVNFLNNIDQGSKLVKILLPEIFAKQVFNLENYLENNLFLAIKSALLYNKDLIAIEPLPAFNVLFTDLKILMYKKQGSELEGLYLEYEREYETFQQLKSISKPNEEISKVLILKKHKLENMFLEIEKFFSIIAYMEPSNLYWLDKILREKLHNPQYILTCLYSIKSTDPESKYLYKMLHEVVSDLLASRFQEQNADHKDLTQFINTWQLMPKKTMVQTLLKIHLEFDLSKDEDLAKLFSNIIEEFVYGCGGMKKHNDPSRLLPYDKVTNMHSLLLRLLNILSDLHKYKQQDHLVHRHEKRLRSNIYLEQAEETKEILLIFNKFTDLQYQEILARDQIIIQELEEKQELLNNKLKDLAKSLLQIRSSLC